jgi:hypothetical protein
VARLNLAEAMGLSGMVLHFSFQNAGFSNHREERGLAVNSAGAMHDLIQE